MRETGGGAAIDKGDVKAATTMSSNLRFSSFSLNIDWISSVFAFNYYVQVQTSFLCFLTIMLGQP